MVQRCSVPLRHRLPGPGSGPSFQKASSRAFPYSSASSICCHWSRDECGQVEAIPRRTDRSIQFCINNHASRTAAQLASLRRIHDGDTSAVIARVRIKLPQAEAHPAAVLVSELIPHPRHADGLGRRQPARRFGYGVSSVRAPAVEVISYDRRPSGMAAICRPTSSPVGRRRRNAGMAATPPCLRMREDPPGCEVRQASSGRVSAAARAPVPASCRLGGDGGARAIICAVRAAICASSPAVPRRPSPAGFPGRRRGRGAW